MGTRFSPWTTATACGLLAAVAADVAPVGATFAGASEDPPFEALVEPISDALAEEMSGVSWRPGCPVPISDLRLITMNHWGFDDELHRGELVVHEAVGADIASVFGEMFVARFPILRMERIEVYDGDDDASMAADNTSAFNCREITGGGAYSVHSWGQAVDINPIENPYVKDGLVLPPAGAEFLDRADIRPGMIVHDDVVVNAFAAIGFDWGGDWDRLKDYQHFEATDPTSGGPGPAGPECPSYTANPAAYPVRLCQHGPAVESVQAQLVRHGYDVEIDTYFGPATLAAVRRFQSDQGLEVDGLVGPITWTALLAGESIGTDEDGNGTVEPWEIRATTAIPACSSRTPSSDAWTGEERALVDLQTGEVDEAPFNEFLSTADPPVSTSPCDAARVLLHLDRTREDGETVVVVVEPEGGVANSTVTVTFEHLADDSVAAVRYVLHFEDNGDGTIRLASGSWSQRCQPGRGHQEFSIELCV